MEELSKTHSSQETDEYEGATKCMHRPKPGKIQYRTDRDSRILHVPTYFVLMIGVSPVNYPDPDPRFKHKISYGVLCMKGVGQIGLAR